MNMKNSLWLKDAIMPLSDGRAGRITIRENRHEVNNANKPLKRQYFTDHIK
jgi:hypothetical protein